MSVVVASRRRDRLEFSQTDFNRSRWACHRRSNYTSMCRISVRTQQEKRWQYRQQPDGLIQVVEREHHDAAEAFPGFRKGTIGDDDLARRGPQCLGGAGTLQSDVAQPLSALDTLLVEGDALLHHGLKIAFR